MHLSNFPKIRLKEYPRGWIVEIQKRTWFGKRYWTHIISVAGIEKEPWYYSTMDIAVEEAKKNFGWDLYLGFVTNNK